MPDVPSSAHTSNKNSAKYFSIREVLRNCMDLSHSKHTFLSFSRVIDLFISQRQVPVINKTYQRISLSGLAKEITFKTKLAGRENLKKRKKKWEDRQTVKEVGRRKKKVYILIDR
jgi:hypothetical protein